MSAIAKTIWMIESRFGETVSLDEMAAHAGVSRSHLSRIFPMATGYSISAYIRGRRLTEAAKALAHGAPERFVSPPRRSKPASPCASPGCWSTMT